MSKHAGEVALRERQDALAARGVRLIVITGDLVEGTITPKLLARAADRIGQATDAPEDLPTTTEMGEAIADAATDATLPTGHTVVVGRALEECCASDAIPVQRKQGLSLHGAMMAFGRMGHYGRSGFLSSESVSDISPTFAAR
ncbi:MAG: hypothetical protein U0841_14825 [Chloroflexia bacterium]